MEQVIIHARYAPDGTVADVGERPDELAPQQWFNLLCDKAAFAYQALAGGRVVFRLTRDQLANVKAAAVAA